MSWHKNKEICKMAKLHIGPMSKPVVDAIIEHSNETGTVMSLIASRRQIDYRTGYVNKWTTPSFAKYVKSKADRVLVCRDHGGILQGDNKDDGLFSFEVDAVNMDVIHIDPWKAFPNNIVKSSEYTKEIIEKCCDLSSHCLFEIGTEESIQYMDANFLNDYLTFVKDGLSSDQWERVVYSVIQSGTKLRGNDNLGVYEEDRLKDMVEVCRKFDLMSKEHNGDYLENEVISKKFRVGLDGINIAPEYAKVHTDTILDDIDDDESCIHLWFMLCLEDGRWRKWFKDGHNPKENKIEVIQVAGHYVLSNVRFNGVISQKRQAQLEDQIKSRIKNKLANTLEEI